ncbi:cupin domain-containing protein [uncultured Piscinibacter sp.]|uniref:JmjC domain-containing protein n=1 Tax=uncultured Piscinibacter sp. TaxID=1131835 RepID=UPI002637C911|nr:cupin domain-containing protein [uncultured Piscinibacter sp.]
MDIASPTALLGGLSPQQFMRRHWQKKPLLVRQALPMPRPFVSRAELFALAASEDVESRLIVRDGRDWTLRHGPLARRALPALTRTRWSLLVQGLDLHLEQAREMLERFRFVPDARLDDVMVSFATDGGGVGPHFDSYDVFLLQIHGTRRWRIGRLPDPQLQKGVPLKILTNFVAEQEWLLEPGDMLYLPPRWAHDGTAEGECMTCSIGFRAAGAHELARDLLQRALDADEAREDDRLYRDPKQQASTQPGRIPEALREFARVSLQHWLHAHGGFDVALGEVLSEPKPGVWFDAGASLPERCAVRLDRRTRMLHDAAHVFINGEAFRAGGRDATLMRRLADRRELGSRELAALSDDARGLLEQWAQAGWIHAVAEGETR